MKTFATKAIQFNKELQFKGKLPKGIKVMNPYEDKQALKISSKFYRKYYNDHHKRFLILGINPGRFGAGLTGIPFTDTKRLVEVLKIDFPGPRTHEPSATFVYNLVEAMEGPENFYGQFYIQSICPLGFTITNKKGKDVNYNYYDSKSLEKASMDFILESIYKIIDLGIHTDTIFCLGTGKNLKFVKELNKKYHLFGKIIPLEHPRYVMQYKHKKKDEYVAKFVSLFQQAIEEKNPKKKAKQKKQES